MKIQNAIDDAYIELKKNQIKSAQLDCEILMAQAIKKDREFVILNSSQEINQQNYFFYRKLINDRSKGKPIAYLIGKKAFWKHEFYISDKVLIPRPDTELIVEEVLRIFKYKDKKNLLDVGTGSGCLILSILKEKINFVGTGIDLSDDCLKICKINANYLGIKNRLKLFKSDIDNFYIGKYDLIISNPPYIKKLDLKTLGKEVNFEPNLALDGGLEGLSEIRKVIIRSSELIKKGGKLILEIAYDQTREVKKLLKTQGFFINCVIKDLAKNDRCLISTKI